jgi:DNA-binding beta-propeller fold protein YncE
MTRRSAWLRCLTACAVISFSSQAAASSATDCHEAIAGSVAAQVRAYQTLMADCLKNGDYLQTSSFCGDHLELFGDSSDQMDAALEGPDAPCALAVAEGLPLAELHAAQCPPGFSSCDQYTVDDLPTVGDCIRCNVAGVYDKLQRDLAFPETKPASTDEHKCMRGLHKTIGKAVKGALRDAGRCAAEGNADCALDTSDDSRFAKARRALGTRVARCRDADGNVGAAGGTLARLCNSAVVSADDLSACVARATTCQACLATDLATGQQHDCAAVSGDRSCRLDLDYYYGALEGGAFMVANEGDSTVTFFQPDGAYADGTLAASSVPVGGPPSELALVVSTNTVFSVSSSDDSVTALDPALRAPAGASVVASTTAVGDAPSAVAVHEERQILYVANQGEDSVTMLDASDGSYLHGSLAASTVPVGDSPTAILVDPEEDIVYVAVSGNDAVQLLDAKTGAPLLGTLELSGFPACDAPRALTMQEWSYGLKTLFVACEGDNALLALDARTGALNEPYELSRTLPGAPSSLATNWYGGFATLPASDEVTCWREGGLETIDGDVETATLPSAADPSDLAISMAGDAPYGEEVLLSVSKGENLVQKSPFFRTLGLLGLHPFERNLVEMDVYAPVVSNEANGVLYMRDDGGIVFVDADSLAVLDTVPVSPAWDFAFDATRNRIYALTANSSVVMIDATTGDYVHGTIESSSYTCACPSPSYQLAVSPAAARIYLKCEDRIAYMDADTGACLGSTPPFSPYFACGMAPDPATGRLLAGGCQNWTFQTNGQGSVLELDATVPQFLGATPADSVLASGLFGISSMEVGPLSRRLYIATLRDLVSLDADTGAVLHNASNYRTYRSFEVDEANNLLRVLEEESPVTVGSRLAYVNATTLAIDAVLSIGSPYGLATHASGWTTISTASGLVQVDPFAAAYRIPGPALASETYATGPSPTAIVVAPPRPWPF